MNQFFNIVDRVVVVTGGFGLLGSSLVRSFLSAASWVAVFDLKSDDSFVKSLKPVEKKQFRFYPCDITDVDSIQTATTEVIRELGRIDVLVNCAYPKGHNWGRIFEKVELEDWCRHLNDHLGGCFNTSQRISLEMMKRGHGSIVNIASIYGMVGPDFSIYDGTSMTMPVEYSAIKGGVINLTRYLATYLAKYGIRVNAVSPGGIYSGQPDSFVRAYEKKVPMGRMATPEDICGAVLFLASDGAKYVTGQNIAVDGGWTSW